MERVNGVSVGEADASKLTRKDRDDVGFVLVSMTFSHVSIFYFQISAWIIELCLKELFQFRAMQTDPNWSNFLWNPETRQVCFLCILHRNNIMILFQIELIDFGATRTYSKEFMDMWLSLLQSAAAGDREACIAWSLKLGYLTGEENQVSHCSLVLFFIDPPLAVHRSCLMPMLNLWLFLPHHSSPKPCNHFPLGKERNGRISPTRFVHRYLWCWNIV